MEDSPKDKFCPSCTNMIELNEAYWPIRRVLRADGTFKGVFGGYCRKCKQTKEAQRQKDRRHGIPPKRSRCDVCGELRADMRHFSSDSLDTTLPPGVLEEDVRLDPACLDYLQRCEWSSENVTMILEIFQSHNAEEEDRNLEWRANRRRPSHLGIDDPPFWNHLACEIETTAWTHVLIFLERQEKIRVSSQWERAALGDLR